MVKREIRDILEASRQWGWVLEPDAKRAFSLFGFDTPRYVVAKTPDAAASFAAKIGYPVVAKVVSPKVIHKSEVKGVIVGIASEDELAKAFDRLRRIEGFSGMLVEEMVSGVELIIGAKIDHQFGPMILLGIGGVGVEIYRDTSLRMAPLDEKDARSMVKGLKAHRLLEGYRGSDPISMDALFDTLLRFSRFVMKVEGLIASIDLNPAICTSKRCVIADARIILAS